MDTLEALRALATEAREFAGRTHNELMALIDEPFITTVIDAHGSEFQIEVSAAWDDQVGQTLRLFFSMDDGGTRSFPPLTRGALVAPGTAFDGELH